MYGLCLLIKADLTNPAATMTLGVGNSSADHKPGQARAWQPVVCRLDG
jgi:hypothetical protein